jgi:hypothetical protein
VLGNNIALIGGPKTGKTTLHAALRAKWGRLPDPPFPEDQKVPELVALNRRYCASFVFTGNGGVVDLYGNSLTARSEQWETDLAVAVKRLREKPLRYAEPTENPSRHWAELKFMIHNIQSKEEVASYIRPLSIIDVPGRSLDPESPYYDSKTVQVLNDADALIIFIDMKAAPDSNSDEAQRMMKSISTIVEKASENPIYLERRIPASIVFSKADAAFAPEKLSAANDKFFERYSSAAQVPMSR